LNYVFNKFRKETMSNYNTEEFRILSRSGDMIHVIHKSEKVYLDKYGIERTNNDPYTLPGVWIHKEMLEENNIQLTLFN